jgi:fucose permease
MSQAAGGLGAGIAPLGPVLSESQRKSIFIASFLTLIAAGIGFGIRGGILGDWGAQFGFTKSDLGVIAGAGLAGFGITIIFFSFFADTVGYKALLILAFLLLAISAVVTLAATPVFHASGKGAAYTTLYIGTFIFSLAQGLCEAAINPLTATLFPKQKTKYLNILHAGWPLGLMIGGLVNYFLVGHMRWEILASLYLVPTLAFGFLVVKNPFPISEAKAAGVSLGQMIGALFAPMLLFLFLIHGMIGYVELGTDSWIQNILNNTMAKNASLLFAYTSILMVVLRLFAGPILHKLNPLGLLCIAACCGAVGLYLLGSDKVGITIWIAATIFAFGKSFYWGTMLGLIGERFPRGGALAMGISGGIGMLSAGFLGGPGIGYTYDAQASKQLNNVAPDTYTRVASDEEKHFLFLKPIHGLDGSKLDVIQSGPTQLMSDLKAKPDDKSLQTLSVWYETVEKPHIDTDKPIVTDANIYGGRQALKITSTIPLTMAACYLILVLYFIGRGGYKTVHLDSSGRTTEVSHSGEEEESIEARAGGGSGEV